MLKGKLVIDEKSMLWKKLTLLTIIFIKNPFCKNFALTLLENMIS